MEADLKTWRVLQPCERLYFPDGGFGLPDPHPYSSGQELAKPTSATVPKIVWRFLPPF